MKTTNTKMHGPFILKAETLSNKAHIKMAMPMAPGNICSLTEV
jgi:hypothetical protein